MIVYFKGVGILFSCINGINDFKFGNSNGQIHQRETCDISLARKFSLCV